MMEARTACIFLASCCLSVSHAADHRKPSNRIDLSHWKLTLPVDADGATAGKATEIPPGQLSAGCIVTRFFRIDTDGALVFWCPVNGARTENTEYPRSELREVPDPSDDNVTWHATGSHVMQARCKVTELPSSQKVIIGQIHSDSGKARPLIKLQYFRGRIEALIKSGPRKGGDLKHRFPDVGLGNDFTFEIRFREGILDVTVNDQTHTQNVFKNDPDWAGQTFYFKAGAYVQDNEGPATEGGRVVFSRLKVSHSGFIPDR